MSLRVFCKSNYPQEEKVPLPRSAGGLLRKTTVTAGACGPARARGKANRPDAAPGGRSSVPCVEAEGNWARLLGQRRWELAAVCSCSDTQSSWEPRWAGWGSTYSAGEVTGFYCTGLPAARLPHCGEMLRRQGFQGKHLPWGAAPSAPAFLAAAGAQMMFVFILRGPRSVCRFPRRCVSQWRGWAPALPWRRAEHPQGAVGAAERRGGAALLFGTAGFPWGRRGEVKSSRFRARGKLCWHVRPSIAWPLLQPRFSVSCGCGNRWRPSLLVAGGASQNPLLSSVSTLRA